MQEFSPLATYKSCCIFFRIQSIPLLSLKLRSIKSQESKRDVCTQCLCSAMSLARGIHSLQGSPSILLIKQWLCTQPIQGKENATQRDKNIKHSAIWEGKVPNNYLFVIMKAQSFFLSCNTPKNGGRRTEIYVFISPCILLSLQKRKKTLYFSAIKGKKLTIQRL